MVYFYERSLLDFFYQDKLKYATILLLKLLRGDRLSLNNTENATLP
ncbi:MAG: hypothetical protein AAGF26_10285 [Cyanobacteria bacterium P01_G01_bin.49]